MTASDRETDASLALGIRGLRFSFPSLAGEQPRPILDGVDFALKGSRLGVILGGADAGKTTLSRICAGLVPRFTGGRLTGSVSIGGASCLGRMPFDAVQSIGLVFQDPDEQIFTTRCDTEIAFGMESLGIERAEMERRVEESLDFMGLREMRARNPATLSGGEKKRLLLACLAAIDPPLWILDEIFQELDAFWKSRLMRRLSGTGKSALFFDSRWSQLYGSHCRQSAVLHEGVVSPLPASEHAEGREELLLRHGLVVAKEEPRHSASRPEPLLRAENLSFRFTGQGAFSLEIDRLDLEKGVVCSLVGRNGSGKSTLGKILCGLLPTTRGSISLFRGDGFHAADAAALHGAIGYLFQNPDYQVFLPTVSEELSYGLRCAGVTEAEAQRRVDEAIRLFRLPAENMPPSLMSYGARKRLQAATFHLLGRPLLILDEIDAGLTYAEFVPLVELMSASGAGVVLITHDMGLARLVSRRIIMIEAGRITRDLAPDRFGEVDVLAGEA